MPITVTHTDTVAVLNLGDDENRFSLGFLDDVNAHLDDIESSGAGGLVTAGTGKFYSNGLDLDWLLAHGDQMDFYVGRVHALFARVLTWPMPTAAALNGHAFGAGAMLAMAHDYRVMRARSRLLLLPRGRHPHPVHARHGCADPGQAHPGGRRRLDDHRTPVRRQPTPRRSPSSTAPPPRPTSSVTRWRSSRRTAARMRARSAPSSAPCMGRRSPHSARISSELATSQLAG